MPAIYRKPFMAEAQRGTYRKPAAEPEPAPPRPKGYRNPRKPWAPSDSKLLAQLLYDKTPLWKIAALMGRANETIRKRAQEMGIEVP